MNLCTSARESRITRLWQNTLMNWLRSIQGMQDVGFPRVIFSNIFSRGICPQTPLYDYIIRAFGADSPLPCEQRLHFRCRSWRAKSSLCRQPSEIRPEIRRNKFKKTAFFLFLTGLEHCVSLAWILLSRSELTQFLLIPAKLAPFDDRPDD